MKLSRILVLAVALIAGVVAAFLALNLTSQPEVVISEPVTETAPMTRVLVAAEDISIGTSIAPDMVKWQEWPENGVSGRFIVDGDTSEAFDSVIQAIARASFYEGEPIIEGKLIRPDSGFLSAILPAGMRAVATSIAAETSAGGFILPNDRVDVIMTRRNEEGSGTGVTEYVTETVLNNVRVLAIDQTIEDKDGEQVVVGQTATLELSAQQAQILTVAQQVSQRLTLALRSIADAGEADGEGRDAVHLIGRTRQNGAVTVVKGGIARDVGGIR